MELTSIPHNSTFSLSLSMDHSWVMQDNSLYSQGFFCKRRRLWMAPSSNAWVFWTDTDSTNDLYSCFLQFTSSPKDWEHRSSDSIWSQTKSQPSHICPCASNQWLQLLDRALVFFVILNKLAFFFFWADTCTLSDLPNEHDLISKPFFPSSPWYTMFFRWYYQRLRWVLLQNNHLFTILSWLFYLRQIHIFDTCSELPFHSLLDFNFRRTLDYRYRHQLL